MQKKFQMNQQLEAQAAMFEERMQLAKTEISTLQEQQRIAREGHIKNNITSS